VKRVIVRGLASGVVALAVLGMLVVEVRAQVDLSGTYFGTRTCAGISGNDGTQDNFPQDATVVVIQTGSALFFHNINDAAYYNGQFVQDSKNPQKKGTLTVVSCQTSKDLALRSEIVQLAFTNLTQAGVFLGPHTMSGTSVLLWDHGDQFTCKWNLKWDHSATVSPTC